MTPTSNAFGCGEFFAERNFPFYLFSNFTATTPGKHDIFIAGRFGFMLPKGSAKKVTIYLNKDTRSHIQPLWAEVLGFLRHKHAAGATMFRADVGFGAHDLFSDPQSEYTPGHSAVRIELIDTMERVDALLPTLYEMVTDGLIVEQDVTVVKSISSDAKQKQAEVASPMHIVNGPAKMVRIYLGESDQLNGEPLFEAIVKKLRMMDFAGATVYRGILGYGAKGQTHEGGRFGFSHDLPIMISVVETPEKLSDLVRVVSDMMQDGMIVTSDVELHRIEHELPNEEV